MGAVRKCDRQDDSAEAEAEIENQGDEQVTLRLRIYEFIAAPAHAWLWLCGRVLGMRFECGPVTDDEATFD